MNWKEGTYHKLKVLKRLYDNGEKVTFEHLIELFDSDAWELTDKDRKEDGLLALEVMIRKTIVTALEKTKYNQRKAARLLQITPRRLN